MIVISLYGLTTSAERFRSMLEDFLRTCDFTPSFFNKNIWMKISDTKDGYDYIYRYADDFKVVSENPSVG